MDKEILDEIIESHKAQPVGYGYIDIIVSRDKYESFVRRLIENGFSITDISWWEWCENKSEGQYGLGGPESVHFNGRFSELSVDIDKVELDSDLDNGQQIERITQTIKNKTLSFPGEQISFEGNTWLTPGIWLDVPKDWRNKYDQ